MSGLGLSLVGAGPWGQTLARALERAGGSPLRWICEVDPDRRSHARNLHPDSRVTAHLDDVLADPGVAAVAVAVDSAHHYAVGRQVLRAGRHLLVEKPMALATAQAFELLSLAGESARVLTVGHLLLHHPAVVRLRDMVAAGALGHVTGAVSTRAVPGPPRTPGSSWWNLAPHNVSLVLHLFAARPTTVRVTAVDYRDAEHDASVRAELRFDDGRVAEIEVSRFALRARRQLSLVGTRRSVMFDELDPTFSDVDPLLAQCRHFIASVVRGDVAAGNGRHSLDVVRVLEAGARSIRSNGAPIVVPAADAGEAARNVA